MRIVRLPVVTNRNITSHAVVYSHQCRVKLWS